MPEEERDPVWDVDDEGLPISAGAKRAVELLDRKWGARYERLARRVTWLLGIYGVGLLVALVAQGIVIHDNAVDSARQDAAIIRSQAINCQSVGLLRDAMEAILVRAYGQLDPKVAKAIVERIAEGRKRHRFPPLQGALIPKRPGPTARQLTPAAKRVAAKFYEDGIRGLERLVCHVARKTNTSP